jgi:hypothetical protein
MGAAALACKARPDVQRYGANKAGLADDAANQKAIGSIARNEAHDEAGNDEEGRNPKKVGVHACHEVVVDVVDHDPERRARTQNLQVLNQPKLPRRTVHLHAESLFRPPTHKTIVGIRSQACDLLATLLVEVARRQIAWSNQAGKAGSGGSPVDTCSHRRNSAQAA